MEETSTPVPAMVARFCNGASPITRLLPGCGLSALLALAAAFVATLHGGPTFLYALLFGVAFHYLSHEPRSKPGIEFSARTVLRLGVGLLGARITAAQIAGLGWLTAAVVVLGIATTIGFAMLLGQRLGMSRAQQVLAGGAVAICGASAALAISAVLPREKEGDRFTLMVVVTVTVLSTVAMIIYPLIARALGLSPALAGLFIGGTIHDVAQVVGAGYTLGQHTGDIATVVKLFRVAMLTVVVVTISATFKRSREAVDSGAVGKSVRQPLVPWFLWMFVAMVVLNSLDAFNAPVKAALDDLSRACLVTAIAALGMKTSFAQLARAGWRPMLLIVAGTVWLAALVAGAAMAMA